jgi:hypothetical protein
MTNKAAVAVDSVPKVTLYYGEGKELVLDMIELEEVYNQIEAITDHLKEFVYSH